ncbi:hypothetical protein [Marinitoga aeolica]|uniref:Uncharacterized protein n=1 Tax=Marinitoga aeolica TaxID=2809031 RepID=A0ABY8PN46_9BACT|nr:hypothetical protein [Marinitoga aeolica]WGS64072.1 hypothetical protein JRV97_06725 [Marinitoga aeolica]
MKKVFSKLSFLAFEYIFIVIFYKFYLKIKLNNITYLYLMLFILPFYTYLKFQEIISITIEKRTFQRLLNFLNLISAALVVYVINYYLIGISQYYSKKISYFLIISKLIDYTWNLIKSPTHKKIKDTYEIEKRMKTENWKNFSI